MVSAVWYSVPLLPPQNLLSDERLFQSEALYAFLSPSPDYLKVIDVQGKKTSFSLSSFLEKLPRDFFSHQEVSSPKGSPISIVRQVAF